MSQAYINGELVDKSKGQISIFDRGFLFADSVYEVVPAFGRTPFQMQPHIERLIRSCNELGFGPLEVNFEEVFHSLLKSESANDLGFYIQVTRGQGETRNHIYTENMRPNVVAFLQEMTPTKRSDVGNGFSAITAEDGRWNRCDIKSNLLLPNIMSKTSADRGSHLETLYTVDGNVVEATASNVFAVRNGTLMTPGDSENILRGITRNFIVDQAQKMNIPVEFQVFPYSEIHQFDEVWISSSTKNALPITEIDGKPVGEGKPGPVWSRVFELFESQFGW